MLEYYLLNKTDLTHFALPQQFHMHKIIQLDFLLRNPRY